MKLIEGKKYILFYKTWSKPDTFTYEGYRECGYNCDRCGRVRKRLHIFYQGNIKTGNLTQVAKYGSECLKHIKINSV